LDIAKAMNAILTKFLKPTHLEYIVINREFLIEEATEGAAKFADGEGQIQGGRDVRDYFPELFGLEDILTDIFEGLQPNFDLKDIGRFHDSTQPLYFDLYIFNSSAAETNGQTNYLVIACEDATERTVLAQKLGQVANDYALLLNKLNSNKNYLKKIINSLKDALIVTDIEGNIKKNNPACWDLFGYNMAELLEQPISMLFENSAAYADVKNIEKLLNSEEDVEINCLTKAGEKICISFSCALVDANSEPKNFVWIGRDITQRKRYEQALYNLTNNLEKRVEERTAQLQRTARKLEAEMAERLYAETALEESESRLSNLLQSLQDVVWSFDPGESKVLYLNPAAEKLYGRAVAEFYKNSNLWVEVIAPEYRQEVEESISELVEQDNWELEYPIVRPDGEMRWVRSRSYLVRDAQGKAMRVDGITTDITERKRTEDALKASDRFIQRIAQTNPNFLYIYDIVEQNYVYANREIATFLGYPPEQQQQIETDIWENLLHPEDADKVREHHNRFDTAKEGEIVEISYRLRHASGEWRWFHSWDTVFAVTDNGLPEQILGTAADITERIKVMEYLQLSEAREREKANQLEAAMAELKRTQAQLVQSEKMVSLGNMVAGVAHEINNPVNFIYGNITHATDYANDLLELVKIYQESYPEPLPEIETALEEIDAEFLIEDFPKVLFSMKMGAERISEIVKSLRNFSRLDEADLKQVNIHEGIDSTLLILHNRLKAKSRRPDIAVVKNYGSMPPVMCYPGELNQVFMNVIGNAIDALEEASSGTKAGDKFEPTIWIETEMMASQRIGIKIRDNGLGIKPEAVCRLFDPFYTTKPPGKGTGLGLSICYQIVVERHGGSLHCSSRPGTGAEFTIEIPICAQIANGTRNR